MDVRYEGYKQGVSSGIKKFVWARVADDSTCDRVPPLLLRNSKALPPGPQPTTKSPRRMPPKSSATCASSGNTLSKLFGAASNCFRWISVTILSAI